MQQRLSSNSPPKLEGDFSPRTCPSLYLICFLNLLHAFLDDSTTLWLGQWAGEIREAQLCTLLLAALCLELAFFSQFLNPSPAGKQARGQAGVLTCLDRGGRAQTLRGAGWCCWSVGCSVGWNKAHCTCLCPRPAGAPSPWSHWEIRGWYKCFLFLLHVAPTLSAGRLLYGSSHYLRHNHSSSRFHMVENETRGSLVSDKGLHRDVARWWLKAVASVTPLLFASVLLIFLPTQVFYIPREAPLEHVSPLCSAEGSMGGRMRCHLLFRAVCSAHCVQPTLHAAYTACSTCTNLL